MAVRKGSVVLSAIVLVEVVFMREDLALVVVHGACSGFGGFINVLVDVPFLEDFGCVRRELEAGANLSGVRMTALS